MPIIYNDPLRGRPREAARIPAPTSTVLTEQFGQSFEENPIAAGKRWYDLEHQKSFGKRIDAGSAREQLKAAGLESDLTVDDAGITQEALDTLMWRKRTEKRRQDIFSRAEGGFAQGAARLGVAAAATLADPISAGLNFVPVVGQARYAKWLGAAGSIAGRTGVRAAVGAAEGAAGAAIVEPLIYASRTAEQADYDAVDSLMNVAFGGLIGTGMHTTVGGLGEVFARARPAARQGGVSPPTPRQRIEPTFDAAADLARAMKPEDFQATVRAAVGQAVEGRPIDVDAVVRAATIKSEEVIGYTTARGSTYEIAGDGTTTRNKAARPEHPGDFGPQPRSENTFYVTPEDAIKLGEFQTIGDIKRSVAPTSDGRLGVRYDTGPMAGKFERRTVVTPFAKPAKGLIPVETWKDGARVHFGNEISEIRYGAAKSRDVAGRQDIESTVTPRAAIEQRATADDPVELDTYAEETIAADVRATDNTEDTVAAAKEEETLATQQLKELYDRLGRELKSAEYDEVIEAATNAERWARTAELATVCMIRGG